MTITNENQRDDYIGNDVTTVFNYTFRITVDADLELTRISATGVKSTPILGTDYSVQKAGEDTGTITLLLGALLTGETLTIRRILDFKQETDIANQSAFFANIHEDSFDRFVMLMQQLAETDSRSLKVPEEEVGSIALSTLPNLATRKSKFFAWNAAGEPIAASGVTSVPVSTFMETLLDDTSAVAGRDTLLTTIGAVLTSQSTQRDDYNILNLGAYENVLQQPATANFKITGISTFFDSSTRRRVVFINKSTFDITLAHDNGSSSSAHRMLVSADGTDLVIPPDGVAYLDYDIDKNKWRVTGISFPRTGLVVKATNYTLLTSDSEATFTNEGAAALVTFSLPTARVGLRYSFIIQDVDGIQVDAAAGDTIRIGASVSAAAGNINATVIGNTITLVAINATEWVALSREGTWTVT